MSVLLLHGFTGHPSDLEPLRTAFEARGISCYLPLLPGHGTNLDDLNRVQASDWLDAVRHYDSDIIVGMSMGGLLAVCMAAERPISKLILLSPAFFLQPFGRFGAWAAEHGLAHILSSFPKKAGSDIADPVARSKSQAYQEVPLKALVQFEQLRQSAIRVLPKVTCPVFSFFGAKDHTVDIKKASLLVKNPVIFERSAHVLPLDYDQKELISQCLKILEN